MITTMKSTITRRKNKATRIMIHMIRIVLKWRSVIFLLVVVLPLAHPFATATTNNHHHQHQQQQQQKYPHRHQDSIRNKNKNINIQQQPSSSNAPRATKVSVRSMTKDDDSIPGSSSPSTSTSTTTTKNNTRRRRFTVSVRDIVATLLVKTKDAATRRIHNKKYNEQHEQILQEESQSILTNQQQVVQKKNNDENDRESKNTETYHHDNNDHHHHRWKGEEEVSLLSRLFYGYASPIIRATRDRTLDVADSLPMKSPYKNSMKYSVSYLQQIYHDEQQQQQQQQQRNKQLQEDVNKKKTSSSTTAAILTKALFIHQKNTVIKTGILRLLNTAMQVFPALLVARLLRIAESSSSASGIGAVASGNTIIEAFKAALSLVIVLSIKMIIENQLFHNLINGSMQVRGILAGLLFDKSLRLHNGGIGTITKLPTTTTKKTMDAEDETTTDKNKTSTIVGSNASNRQSELGIGGVLNLMQSDASIVESAALQIHTSWDGPLQIAVYTCLLFRYLGTSVLYGIAVLLTTIPLNSITLRMLNKLAMIENQAKDTRTKQTAESIRNMKLVKLLSWESLFEREIMNYRNKELRSFVSRGMVRAINMAISNAVPAVVLVVTLTAYVRAGKPVVASTIFTAISLFNQLRFPLYFYPMFIDSFANGRNAINRIAHYLDTSEIPSYVEQLQPIPITIQQQRRQQERLSSSTSIPSDRRWHRKIPTTDVVPSSSSSYLMNNTPTITTTTKYGGSIEMKNGNFMWSSSSSTSPTKAAAKSSSAVDDNRTNDNSNGIEDNSYEGTTDNDQKSTNLIQATKPKEGTTAALRNIELKVNPGEIVAVVGNVGSGKSALIKGLLGELIPASVAVETTTLDQRNHNNDQPDLERKPTVIRHGDVAYCSQEAWLSKGTVRDAVVFGRVYNEERYLQAIYNAGLDEDIVDDTDYSAGTTIGSSSSLSKEDSKNKNNGVLTHETDVGEGGSSLSGGQRQRVAIARALYSASESDAAKVYLLDDCLSALDAHVGAVVFERMTKQLTESNAATVLVTNDPNLPRRCDRVILMGSAKTDEMVSLSTPFVQQSKASEAALSIGGVGGGSTIIDQGTYDDLIARGHDLQSVITHHHSESDDEDNPEDTNTDDNVGEFHANATFDSYYLNGNKQRDSIQEEIEHTEFATTNNVVQPSLMATVAKDKKNILVIGGATNQTEAELCLDVGWCPSDVEDQATMQNCPAYLDQYADIRAVKLISSNQVVVAEEEYDQPFGAEPRFNASVDLVKDEENYDDSSIATLASTISTVTSDSTVTTQLSTLPVPVVPSTSARKLLSADDSMSTGAIPWSVYATYFKAVGSPILVATMFCAYLLSNGAQFFQQYTVAKWTEVGANSALAGAKYMSSLVKAAGVVSISLWIRSFLTMSVGVKASKSLHARMLRSVFAAPMSFFDTTPSGQLLSRFGNEMLTIDKGVPDSIGSVLFCFLQIFFSMGALAGIVTPGMLIPLAIVSSLYVNAMSKYRPAARDMKRVETKTRSPIFTHFGEALRGSETIRSVRGATQNWSSHHRDFTDTNLQVLYTVKAFDRWLSTRLETLGNTIVFTTAIASVILTRSGALKAGSAGWGLTQALSVTGLLTWAVRCLTDLESNMLSVMRVKELISGSPEIGSDEVDLKKLKGKKKKKSTKSGRMPKELSKAGEALLPLISSSSSPISMALVPIDNNHALVQDGWPWKGNVQFTNVSMRYNPTSPYVLKDINLTVPAGTTLGVVGRTGSGKSSLLVTLFRLVEIESVAGQGDSSIEIDGIDIRTVGMETLRRSVAIIPQDPVLFTGTLAYNLDATGHSSEHDMIAALEAASPSLAGQFLSSSAGVFDGHGLQTQINEGGKNLSLGQRQLICLARALLRKSKILVLDEATSSVDAKTDQEVQETIRREFVNKGVTVITVAHRLDTVLGYDKIAVLGNGKVLEYGTPKELIDIPGGELRKLVLADRRNKQKGSKKKPLINKEDEPIETTMAVDVPAISP